MCRSPVGSSSHAAKLWKSIHILVTTTHRKIEIIVYTSSVGRTSLYTSPKILPSKTKSSTHLSEAAAFPVHVIQQLVGLKAGHQDRNSHLKRLITIHKVLPSR